ncbi:MAG: LTA synthase family protein [Chloroflexota bacterium]|nr:LTA synthase family protein [Chloroflexota bacterium]
MRLYLWVLHPILFAAYPVLFLFAENAADQVSFDALWLPLGSAQAGSAVLLAVATVVFRNVHRGGIAASVLVVAFFLFGHAWNLVAGFIGDKMILLGVWVVAAVVGLALAWRARAWARSATGYLNLVSAIPLVITLVSLGEFAINRTVAGTVINSVGGLLRADEQPRPDIYYLVFDRYAGSPTLESHFGFDNEPFLRELEQRGFYVARDSVANYVKTGLSLTSTLNMEYLDGDELNAEAAAPDDQGVINRRFQGHLTVPTTLKELGYQFVLVPSWWSPTATNVDADATLRYEGTSEFSLALLDTTLLTAFVTRGEEPDPFSMGELRNYTLHQLAQLTAVPALSGPKFVFAHVLLPHPPNLFNRDGGPFEGDETRLTEDQKYVRQVEFANAEILQIVDEIQSRPSDQPAVIVLQADEGPFPDRYTETGDDFQWEEATPEEIEIKFRILNAVHLPGVDLEAAGLSDSGTPVNVFRVVFNALFDAGLPMLPDHAYAHTDTRHYYDFIDVSNRIPRWSASR